MLFLGSEFGIFASESTAALFYFMLFSYFSVEKKTMTMYTDAAVKEVTNEHKSCVGIGMRITRSQQALALIIIK